MKVQLLTITALSLIILINAAPATTITDTITDSASTAGQSLECYMYGDYQFYDLRSLYDSLGHVAASITSDRKYLFNFCSYVSNPCGGDGKGKDSYAYSYKSTPGNDAAECMALTDDEYLPDQISAIAASTITIDDGTTTIIPGSVSFSLQGGHECQGVEAQISFVITCDPNITTPVFLVNDTDECSPIISFTHESGCSIGNMNALASFFQKNPWVLAIIFICVGAVTTFYGSKFIPWVIGFFAGLVMFIVVMAICSAFGMLDYTDPSKNGSLGALIGAVFISLIFAVLMGWLMMKKFFAFGFMLLGFVAGFFLGGMLYNLVLVAWVKSTAVLYVCTFGLALVGVFLAYKFEDQLKIFVTAFLGSYLFVRGISMFAGGFTSEFAMYDEIKQGTLTLSHSELGYFAGIFVLFGVGVWFQMRQKKKDSDDNFNKAN